MVDISMKTAIWLLALTTSAVADTRYVIHPTNGEFVKTTKPCGEATRGEIFNRIIRFTPTLVVDKRKVMTLITKAKEEPADEMIDGIGWWHYDGLQQTKTMIIALKPGGKPSQRVLHLGVVRRMDEIECSEKWVGTVEESRGK